VVLRRGVVAGEEPVLAPQGHALERAFAELSPEHRAVVVLHHHLGMPLALIAEIVGVPVGTVKSRLFHATRMLRVALGDEHDREYSEVRPA